MVIVGGMGSIRGVLLGAAAITLLNLQILKNLSLQINALRNIDFVVPIINYPIKSWPVQLDPARYERLVFGLLLVIMMIRRPAGIIPAQRRRLEMTEEVEIPESSDKTSTETMSPVPEGRKLDAS
jgi:branched-chain amino acid transport system permease protein